jgi:hypothetical protein
MRRVWQKDCAKSVRHWPTINTKSTYRLFGREGSTPIELVTGQRGQQKGKKTLNYDEHDYQRHVRKFK